MSLQPITLLRQMPGGVAAFKINIYNSSQDARKSRGSLTTFGLNGGWISRFASRSQSMRLKKACSLMSISPSGPQPRRLDGCLVISWRHRRAAV